MIAFVGVFAAQGDVPQNPWPFVIIGYVVMALGLIAVALASTVRARRLAQRVPAGERRWLDVRAAEVAAKMAAADRDGPTSTDGGESTL
jgi:hypothetical protein